MPSERSLDRHARVVSSTPEPRLGDSVRMYSAVCPHKYELMVQNPSNVRDDDARPVGVERVEELSQLRTFAITEG